MKLEFDFRFFVYLGVILFGYGIVLVYGNGWRYVWKWESLKRNFSDDEISIFIFIVWSRDWKWIVFRLLNKCMIEKSYNGDKWILKE